MVGGTAVPETHYARTPDGVSLAYHTIGDGPVDLLWLHAFQGGIEVLWEGPRYWPPSWRPISHVPVVGEVVAWNHLILFRRR